MRPRPPKPNFSINKVYPLGFELEAGQWYPIRIEARGGQLRVWVGDVKEPQLDYLDLEPFPTGAVALGGSWHLSQFDNVRVEALPPAESTPGQPLLNFGSTARLFNFGPAGGKIPEGFTLSDGAPFDAAKGYGWDVDMRSFARRRGHAQKDELDTGLVVGHNKDEAVFSVDLPNGEYLVTVVGGDPLYNTSFAAQAEGVELARQMLGKGQWHEARRRITIKDGRLDVTFTAKTDANKTCLSACYLAIEPWNAQIAARDAERLADPEKAAMDLEQAEKKQAEILKTRATPPRSLSPGPRRGRR